MKITELLQLKEKLLEKVSNNGSTAILTHIKPDGDGIGAALALQEILLVKGLKTSIVLERELPSNYSFLQVEKRISICTEDQSFRNIIILDCHERSRLGKCEQLLDTAEEVVVIDHHLQNNVISSDHYIDASMVSVGAIIFRLFEPEIQQLPATSALFTATAIYISIINDTENFINSNTDAETFEICAALQRTGIDPGEITRQFLLNKTAREMKYIGRILTTIEEHSDGKVVFIHSLRSMLKEDNLPSSVNSKILRWVKGLKKVAVIVYFSEVSENEYKLSLRSEIINVNLIAAHFNGGGHQKASGCSIKGSLEQVKQVVLQEIEKQLQ